MTVDYLLVMGIFDRFKKQEMTALEGFAAAYDGVEAYLEPRTRTNPQSLLLVARGGEWKRATISDARQAAAFCKRLGVPFYDARVVGYPERMRGMKGKPAPDAPSPEELEKWFNEGEDLGESESAPDEPQE